MDAGGIRCVFALDETLFPHTAKSCGPDAPTRASSWRRKREATVTNKPVTGEQLYRCRAVAMVCQPDTQRLASHFWRRAIMVLRMTISLRMQATSATLGFFPLAIRRR